MIMKVHSVDLRILGVPTGCVFFLISLVFLYFSVHQGKSLGILVCFIQHLFRNKGISLRKSFDLDFYIYSS